MAPQLRSASASYSDYLDPETRDVLRKRCWADDILYKQAEERLTGDIKKLRYKLAMRLGGIVGLFKRLPTYDLALKSYIKKFQRTSSELDLSFDQPICGDGWHLRETDWKGTFWRWTGPSPSAFLDLPLRATRDLKIDVWILNIGSEATFESLSFKVNGEQISHSTRTEGSQLVSTIICPASIARRGHAVTLEIATPVQNIQPLVDPATPVRCGIAISRVQAHPA